MIKESLKIERVFAMANMLTFNIKPIKKLLEQEINKNLLWIDPFANNARFANITNDLNPEFETDYHMDALDFLKIFNDESVDGVLYDPPYSPRQVKECYSGFGLAVTKEETKTSFWSKHKNEIARIVKTGGKVVSFGWNSSGVGKTRGFEKSRILLVPHGGGKNDTIVTVETKILLPTILENFISNVGVSND